MMMTGRSKRWAGLLVLVVAVATLVALTRSPERSLPGELQSVMVAHRVRLEPVRLIDQRGHPLTDAWFSGRWTFLVFGFTSCPDVCPATLAQLAVLKRTIAEKHPEVAAPQYVFATVDPERDTPAQLAAYLGHFDPAFVGVTGDAAQIAALERPLGAFHRKGAPSASGYYSVSHSAEVFLLDPDARLYARFVPPLKPARVADQLSAMAALYARDAGSTAPSG